MSKYCTAVLPVKSFSCQLDFASAENLLSDTVLVQIPPTDFHDLNKKLKLRKFLSVKMLTCGMKSNLADQILYKTEYVQFFH